MPNLICNSQKYQIDSPKNNSIGLIVELDNLPDNIEVEGYKLQRKSHFHVSLISLGKIIEKYKIIRPDFINEVVNYFCEFVKNNSIDFIRFRDEFRFVAHNERRSVIVMCEVSNLNEFYEIINKKYGFDIAMQPTHITIYTLQPDMGIFLVDDESINNLTKIIALPDIYDKLSF